MYERIMVPLDGSDAAEIVLPYVAQIAAKLGSEINLVSVSESPATGMDHLYSTYLERIVEEVQRQLKDYGAVEAARVVSQIIPGKPADEILRFADKANAGLIAIASRGSSGQGPWFLGTIAAKVLRATGKSVLLIRAPASEAALQRKSLLKKILVPLDGSRVGEAALSYSRELGRALGAELILFQVVELVATLPAYGVTTYFPAPQDLERMRASSIAYMEGITRELKKDGLSVSSAVALGSPADQIIDYALANAVDLIAISTHGRSGVGRWVFGSVTDKVLHAGDTPVLVVRAAKS